MLRLRRRFDEVKVCGKGILNRTRERILWTEAIADGWGDRRQISHMKGGTAWIVTAAMKHGMKAWMRKIGLTEYTSVDLPSKTLDAVPLLIHAPEVVSPYRTKQQ